MFRFTSTSTKTMKGGETMKTLGLVIALTMVVGGASIAATETATIDLYSGWNQIACPLVPMNLSVAEGDGLDYTEPAFALVPFDTGGVRMAWDNNSVFDSLQNGGMTRVDATTGSQPTYLVNDNFGKLLLGDGYQLNVTSACTVSYVGVPNGVPDTANKKTDMWISLPGLQNDGVSAGGWHLVGTPYATPLDCYALDTEGNPVWKIFFTDGTEVVDWQTAADVKGWVGDTMYGAGPGGQVLVSYLNDPSSGGLIGMQPGKGYWLATKVDNLAMIIIAE